MQPPGMEPGITMHMYTVSKPIHNNNDRTLCSRIVHTYPLLLHSLCHIHELAHVDNHDRQMSPRIHLGMPRWFLCLVVFQEEQEVQSREGVYSTRHSRQKEEDEDEDYY